MIEYIILNLQYVCTPMYHMYPAVRHVHKIQIKMIHYLSSAQFIASIAKVETLWAHLFWTANKLMPVTIQKGQPCIFSVSVGCFR